MNFSNILVVGLGLIGGSIIKSLKTHSFTGGVYGLDSNELVLKEAYELGFIQNKGKEIETPLKDLLVVFAVPSLSINKAISNLNEDLITENVLYTDTCSVKSSVLGVLKDKSHKIRDNFILSHPIAGSEKSGLSESSSTLFNKKLTIICPHESNNEDDIRRIEKFWKDINSIPKRLPANKHDELFAKTSHLPHVISYALMDALFNDLNDEIFSYSGGSLESYTRISSSDPVMWKDIMIANSEAVLESIKNFNVSLDRLSELIEKKDENELMKFFSSIKDSRDKLLSKD